MLGSLARSPAVRAAPVDGPRAPKYVLRGNACHLRRPQRQPRPRLPLLAEHGRERFRADAQRLRELLRPAVTGAEEPECLANVRALLRRQPIGREPGARLGLSSPASGFGQDGHGPTLTRGRSSGVRHFKPDQYRRKHWSAVAPMAPRRKHWPRGRRGGAASGSQRLRFPATRHTRSSAALFGPTGRRVVVTGDGLHLDRRARLRDWGLQVEPVALRSPKPIAPSRPPSPMSTGCRPLRCPPPEAHIPCATTGPATCAAPPCEGTCRSPSGSP